MKTSFTAAGLFVLTFLTVASAAEPELTEANSWAFKPPEDPFTDAALLDLRHLNEEIAGQNGWVEATEEGGFRRGDGRPIRFWGTHAKSRMKWSDEEASRNARWLAKLGVNLVRHGGTLRSGEEGSDITDVNERALREQWRTLAVMKQHGIYSMISPFWGYRGFGGPVPESWGIEGYAGKTALAPILIFHPELQRGYKAWIRRLLTEPNPYTGIPLKDEPALAFLEVHNESNLLFHWVKHIHGGPRRILEARFAEWVAHRYGSLGAALEAWDNTEVEGDAPEDGRLGLMNIWFMTGPGLAQTPNAQRRRDTLEFLVETERSFYEEMERYVRQELGYKGLFSTSNFRSADQVLLDDLERWCKSAGDLICRNSYYGSGHRGENAGWRIEPGDFYAPKSATRQPLQLPALKKQVAGLPYILTETLWVPPQPYEAEGPLMVAAYMGMNGMDSALWAGPRAVTWNPNPYLDWVTIDDHHPMRKFLCGFPGTMGNFPASALIHRRSYVKRAEPSVHEERTLEQMLNLQPPMVADAADFDPNQYAEMYRENPDVPGGADPRAFLVGRVETVLDGDPARSRAVDPGPYIAGDAVTSSTEELLVDTDPGLFVLDAPKAQAVAGFLASAGGEFELGDCTISSANDYAAVVVVSLDGLPLAESGRVLVQVGTVCRPTGWREEPASIEDKEGNQVEGFRILSTGSMPWRIAKPRVRLRIRNSRLSRATRLDEAGYPDGNIAVTTSEGHLSLSFPEDTLYVVLDL